MISLPHDLPARLQARLGAPLPGAEAHRLMAPEGAYGRHRGPISPGSHRAAVCICLFRNAEDWWLPLTVRAKQLVDHAGQVSLPGGRLEQNESAAAAAKREFSEELGVSIEAATWLGRLTSIYVYGSHHHVDVFVVAVDHRPVFNAEPTEVAEVLLMPVRELIDSEKQVIATMQRGNSLYDTPGYRCGNHLIWGATAMILHELAVVVRDCINDSTV